MVKEQEPNEYKELQEEEPPIEDFILDEEIDEEAELRKKKRKSILIKIIAIAISFFLVINILSIWLNLYSLESIQFIKKSSELSQQEMIQTMKEAVVTIQDSHSKGTGFAITSDGYILSNHHVVDGMFPIMIRFPNGERYEGEIIEINEQCDIALLKVEGNDLPFLPLSEQQSVINEKVYVIGNPLLHTQIVNDGYILENVESYQVLKISTPIFSGNSGSPVIAERGEVVGVVYARTIPWLNDEQDTVGLAVPIEQVSQNISTLKELNFD